MKCIIKRDGSMKPFDSSKIEKAILNAMKHGSGIVKYDIAKEIAENAFKVFEADNVPPTVYQIEDFVYFVLSH